MALTAGDKAFAWQHAAKWAHGPWRTTKDTVDELFEDERAVAYAHWYYATYVLDADDMADLPSHSAAWDRYLSERDDPFRCLNCGRSYPDQEAMDAHINLDHPEGYGEDVEFCDCTNEELEAGRTCGQPQCPNNKGGK